MEDYEMLYKKQKELILELKSIINYYKSVAFPSAEIIYDYSKEGKAIEIEKKLLKLESSMQKSGK